MNTEARKQPERTLRWAAAPSADMEFKCGGCGHWQSFAHATPLKAGDAYICKGCADALTDALARRA